MSKIAFRKACLILINCRFEGKKEFSIEQMYRIFANAGMYERWESKRGLKAMQDMGLIAQEGAYWVVLGELKDLNLKAEQLEKELGIKHAEKNLEGKSE